MESNAELLFGQLRSAGIVVDGKLTLETIAADDLYVLCRDAVAVVLTPPGDVTKRKAWESMEHQASDAVVAAAKALKKLPNRMPAPMPDRFGSCQSLAALLSSVLGIFAATDDVPLDYSAIMYPEVPKTRGILAFLGQAVSEFAEQLGRMMDAADADDGAADVDEDDHARLPVHEIVKRSLGRLRRRVDTYSGPKPLRHTAVRKPFRSAPLQDASHFEGDVTLVAQLPSQAVAFASFVEYAAIERTRHAAFDKLVAHTLSAAPAVAAKFVPRVAAPAVVEDTVKRGKANTTKFFGSAADIDESVTERRRAEAEAEAANEAQLAALQAAVESKKEQRNLDESELADQLKKAKERVSDYRTAIKGTKAQLKELQKAMAAIEEERAVKQATWEERRDAADARLNLAKSVEDENALRTIEAALAELEAANEQAQKEHEAKLAKLMKKHGKLKAEIDALSTTDVEQVQAIKAEIKALKKARRAKAAEGQQLTREWERCPKGVDRSKFARLVTDMSTSLRKQQIQIDDINRQTEEQLTCIQSSRSTVNGVYTKLEEDVFGLAKKDNFAKDAYSSVVRLREAYRSLVSNIEARGEVKRDQHATDARYAKLQRTVEQYNADGIAADLETLKADVKQLEATIKDRRQA